ncbi:hypothetical protein TIFTF001_012877 [Ficus carica]|uniref:Uncharacterized protein n=1 Tax=Ficus carica TaxID=3494 RepID=A0AA88D6N8_FICCA|nr:hypothetical protein TIFTF001_012877 [Ficus carica]
MSRHRRQASQVLPPEFLSGNEPPRAFDLSDVVVSSDSTVSTAAATTTGVAADKSSTANPQKADASGANSPAQAKKPPPARSA